MYTNPNNICMFRGNLTRDPEIRQAGKSQVAKFGLAVNNYSVKKGEKGSVIFVDCEIWGKPAENLAQHVKKGQEVWVQAEARTDEWTDKTSNQKRTKTVYKVNEWAFVGPKKAAAEPANEPTTNDFEPQDNGGKVEDNVPF